MTATATSTTGRWTPRRIALWTAVAVVGAVAWGILALARGESVNAAWLIVAALCSYAIAYRFYARFIAYRVLGVDAARGLLGHHRSTTPQKPDFRTSATLAGRSDSFRRITGGHCGQAW